MSPREPSFTIGVEEEYLLVDRRSRNLVSEPPAALIEECAALSPAGRVSPEFLQAQIEVGTTVCNSLDEVRNDLAHLRRTVAAVSGKHGLAPIAASTHPFALWREQKHTDKERYRILNRGYAGRRPAADDRRHARPRGHRGRRPAHRHPQPGGVFPAAPAGAEHVVAFLGRNRNGLHSYRLCVFDELPRTGLPERFESYGEYKRTVDLMVAAGLLEDATKLWWDVRPSARFPTIEMRITDVCTQVEDALCCAAVFRCLCRMLYRLRRQNQRWRIYAPLLVHENRWRAQRYGLDEGMVDFGRGEIVPFTALTRELLGILREDAEHFGCVREVEHALTIIERGASSHRQLRTYREALRSGATEREALLEVVDRLIERTVEGCGESG